MAEVTTVRRLPRWAEDKIAALQSEVKAAKRALAAFEGDTATNVFRVADMDYPPLPPSTIRFRFGPTYDDFIDCSIDHGSLLVRGGGTLLTQPEASNTIRVALAESSTGLWKGE